MALVKQILACFEEKIRNSIYRTTNPWSISTYFNSHLWDVFVIHFGESSEKNPSKFFGGMRFSFMPQFLQVMPHSCLSGPVQADRDKNPSIPDTRQK